MQRGKRKNENSYLVGEGKEQGKIELKIKKEEVRK